VDLASLLDAFLRYLEQSGSLDLRLCGSAALTSAVLYRLKVETMFLFERLRPERLSADSTEPPQVIVLPFRYELRSTGIDELLRIFEKVIEEVLSESRQVKSSSVIDEAEPVTEPGNYLMRVREAVLAFRADVLETLRLTGNFRFSSFVRGLPALEVARRFLLLLFLAMEGLITLEQTDEDIRVGGAAEPAAI